MSGELNVVGVADLLDQEDRELQTWFSFLHFIELSQPAAQSIPA
jgi:hypothetical protein